LTRVRASLIAGGIAGLSAALLFATLHAILIVPIWDRMLMGLGFGTAAGLAAGCAFALVMPDSPARVRTGAIYGLLLWLAALPVTLVNIGLRATGFAAAHESWTDAIAVTLAILGGALLGRIRGRSLRAAICGAAAVLMLTMAMGGPVPVVRSVRATGILFGVLIASVAGGVIVAVLERVIRGRSDGAPANRLTS